MASAELPGSRAPRILGATFTLYPKPAGGPHWGGAHQELPVPEPFDIHSIELPADSEVRALLRACPEIGGVRFVNDEFVVHGEDTAMDIFLLLRGNCLVEQPDAPRERTPGSELAVIRAEPDAPVFVGEMAYLGGGYRTASVRSVMATFALRLQPEHLDKIMDGFPGLTRVLCRQFARRLGEANSFIKSFQKKGAMDVSQRFLNTGDILVEAGAPAVTLYQVVDGCLAESEGGGTFQPGKDEPTFIHPAAFFTGAPHPATVVARSPAIAVGMGISRKEAIVRNFPGLVLAMLGGEGK